MKMYAIATRCGKAFSLITDAPRDADAQIALRKLHNMNITSFIFFQLLDKRYNAYEPYWRAIMPPNIEISAIFASNDVGRYSITLPPKRAYCQRRFTRAPCRYATYSSIAHYCYGFPKLLLSRRRLASFYAIDACPSGVLAAREAADIHFCALRAARQQIRID